MTPPVKAGAPHGTHGTAAHGTPAQVKRSGSGARAQTNEERRRAQRVLLRMPVVLHIQGRAKPIQGFTHTVSSNGAMIILADGLPIGSKLSLENPTNQRKVDAHVVRAAQLNAEGSLVPVEFLTASPQFWNIFFPPNSN